MSTPPPQNALLHAIGKGGLLFDAFNAMKPVDCLLVPPHETLVSLGMAAILQLSPAVCPDGALQFAAAWLSYHVLWFDNLAQSFTLRSGLRGAVSDSLDHIVVSGRIGKIAVLSHSPPLASPPQGAAEQNRKEALNILFVADSVLETADVATHLARLPAIPRPNTPPPSSGSTWGEAPPSGASAMTRFSAGVAAFGETVHRLGGTFAGSIAELVRPQNDALEQSAPDAPRVKYADFQQLMQLSESRGVMRLLRQFVDDAQALPSPIDPKRIHAFITDTARTLVELPSWKGQLELAEEGLEKFLMSRLYHKTFCATAEERLRNTVVDHRLKRLGPIVTVEKLDGYVAVCKQQEFFNAVRELRAMNGYKAPRDKLICGANACTLIISAISKVRKHREGEKTEGAGVEGESTQSSELDFFFDAPPPRATPAKSSGGVDDGGQRRGSGAKPSPPRGSNVSADEFLPHLLFAVLVAAPQDYLSNVVYIERYRHPSKMESEQSYYCVTLASAAEFWHSCRPSQLRITPALFNSTLQQDNPLRGHLMPWEEQKGSAGNDAEGTKRAPEGGASHANPVAQVVKSNDLSTSMKALADVVYSPLGPKLGPVAEKILRTHGAIEELTVEDLRHMGSLCVRLLSVEEAAEHVLQQAGLPRPSQ